MCKRFFVRVVGLPLAVLAVLSVAAFVPGVQPAAAAARLIVHNHPDGSDYFALMLEPSVEQPAAGARDVVVLFDTSASQTGEFRTKALTALRSALTNLRAEDRVQLMAVDLRTIPMTETFVAPESPEMAEALTKLERRVPLGSTDLPGALSSAVESFPAGSQNPRALVYIGEGSSRANLLGPEQFRPLAAQLRDARAPLLSYAVGPRIDANLLGALAAQTGGNVFGVGAERPAAEIGRELAAAATAPVLWPTGAVWPEAFAEAFPPEPPPLRTDRENLVIGTLRSADPVELSITAEGPTGPVALSWRVEPGASQPDYAFLSELVAAARPTGGAHLPLLGAESLAHARDAVAGGSRSLLNLARQSFAAGSIDHAEKLLDEVLRRDPDDPEAQALQRAIARQRAGEPAPDEAVAGPAQPLPPPGGAADLNLVGPGAPGLGAGGPSEFAAGIAAERTIVTQVIQAEARNAINQARGQMGQDPEGAIQQLKLQLERVRQAPELNPDVRDQLVGIIQGALREATRRQEELERQRQELYERIAFGKEQQLLLDNLLRDQVRVKQLMDRFNSLMDEGRYRAAEEEVAVEVAQLAPDDPIAPAAALWSRTVGYDARNRALKVAKQKGFMDVTYGIERSSVPFPDEPPIVYPDAEVWRELTAARKERYSSMDLASRGPAERRILDALNSPTQLEFIETPLQDVVDYLKDLHSIEIQIDTKALEDVGLATDMPITRNLRGITLRSALRLTLRELALTYVIEDEVLLITTPEEAENRLTTKVYPVADLVLPIRDPGVTGGFGGLGGMSGGMGGMGGGGMGGGGMGGGGMGGGGGFFNVPVGQQPGVLPAGPARGFFAVPDDLAVAAKPAVPSVDSVVDRTPKADEGLPPSIADARDPHAAWDAYFADNRPEEAAVRKVIRQLMKEQKFTQVIALIQAALRNQQAQPWMYEALALAMQAAGQSRDDIERAVMSAVDFAHGPEEMLHVATYLSSLGIERRALSLFRQVAQASPVHPEPYLFALRSAQRLDDLDGIRWAVTGILSQAWPEDQAEVWRTGLRVANATLERLKAENRTSEAQAFQKALNEAVVRDCVVVVSWAGNADVDLFVEEPSGTVCSLHSPRTTAGGVFMGDGMARLGRSELGGSREVYVCPKGFDGTYRVLVRRVWGDVTAGKVTVDVYTRYRTKDAVQLRKSVSLKNDEALVVFDLEGGRRQEPLADHQVANAAMAQLAVNQQVLAQQLAAAADHRALRDYALARRTLGDDGSTGRHPLFPTGGAVGYQPVIITLPEGANMAMNAVISADRRYVRITAVPMFSAISEVNTFNMATGSNVQGRGGTGGQGFGGMFGGGGGGGGGGGMGGF